VDFDKIYKKYKDAVYNYVFWRVYNEEDAIDITQEVFVKVYKGLDGFQGRSSIKTWIFSIAHNTVLNFLTRKKIDENDIEVHFLSDGSYKRMEVRIKVLRAMEKLSPEHMEILKLYYFDGFSYKEIAKLLKISTGTVKSRLNRAKTSLRENLGDFHG